VTCTGRADRNGTASTVSKLGGADAVGVNWDGIIDGNAITPTVTITSGSTGWPSLFSPPASPWPTIVVKEGSSSNFSLPSDGQGMLIVEGNVTISGSKQWKGIIIVGGTLTSNGNKTYQYDSL
jgi:hypothetical protein